MAAKIAPNSILYIFTQVQTIGRVDILDVSHETVHTLMLLKPIEKIVFLTVLYSNLIFGTGLRLLLLRLIKNNAGLLCTILP